METHTVAPPAGVKTQLYVRMTERTKRQWWNAAFPRKHKSISVVVLIKVPWGRKMPQTASVISPNMAHRTYNTFTLTMNGNVYQKLCARMTILVYIYAGMLTSSIALKSMCLYIFQPSLSDVISWSPYLIKM